MKLGGFWTESNRSATVLSLGLLGDALLYLVLPVSYEEFGLTSVWVGVLLSVNRFVRLAANHGVTIAAQRFGLGAILLLGAILAAGTTLSYGFLAGGAALVIARAAWGVAFASLRLGSLGFAMHGAPETVGRRLGWSATIGQFGSWFGVMVGGWIVQMVGLRETFILLGVLSIIGIPIASGLLRSAFGEFRTTQRVTHRPTRIDLTICIMAMAADGLMVVTLTTFLMEKGFDRVEAISLGGILFGLRQAIFTVIPSLTGFIGDRIGMERTLICALMLVIAGLGLIATGVLIPGFLTVCTSASAAATLFPGVAARTSHGDQLSMLSSVVTWRDLGAAIGSLISGSLLTIVDLQTLYVAAIVLLMPASWSLRKLMHELPVTEPVQF